MDPTGILVGRLSGIRTQSVQNKPSSVVLSDQMQAAGWLEKNREFYLLLSGEQWNSVRNLGRLAFIKCSFWTACCAIY